MSSKSVKSAKTDKTDRSDRSDKTVKKKADDEEEEDDEWREKDPRYEYILQYMLQANPKLKMESWIDMKADPKYMVNTAVTLK